MKKLVILIMFIMSILLIRLFSIQILEYRFYQDSLSKLTTTVIEGDSSPRGRIYDRNGNLIVDNFSVKTIYYKKQKNIGAKEEIKLAYEVSKYIDVDYSKITDNMLKEFWVLNNSKEAKERITSEEWEKLSVRKLTKSDIEKLKKERVTEEDLSIYNDDDREACYIYNLMNKGYYYTEKIIKNENVTDKEYALIAENISKLKGFNVKLNWERYYLYDIG